METTVKHPEVAVVFTRLLSELSLSGSQLARALGSSQQVINGYTSGRTSPGRDMIASIIERYPAINATWLATGKGEPFPTGRYNEQLADKLAAVVAVVDNFPLSAPLLPGAFSSELLDKLLNQLSAATQQHREELADLKKEHKTAMNVHLRLMQAAAKVMNDKIHYMEGRLGLRALTTEEITAQQAFEAPRAAKIGLKHYDESAPVGQLRVA